MTFRPVRKTPRSAWRVNTPYRLLLKVKMEATRNFYMPESIE